MLAGQSSHPQDTAPALGHRTAYAFGSIFALLAAGIVASGYIHYRHFEKQYRAEIERQLSVIAELKDARSLGVLVLRIDPETCLYPLIKGWPTPSPSAETLLVRRDGNEVVYLNELRFESHAALNLRAPLDRATLPAAQAALGHEEVMDGIDYQGVPVVAALRHVPDSPWALVARMNAAEVYAPIRTRLWQMVVLVTAMLIAAGASVGWVWRRQHLRFYEAQAAAAEVLRQSLHEKEMLLKEIHHRVKNNLQIISSLLRLQAGQIDHATTQTVLQDMQNRVRSMALIHEHLYLSKDIASVDLSTYIQSLCQQLFRALVISPGTIQLHLDLASVRLDIDRAIPCGLLVNELVSNALEHAFPLGRHGELWIELHALADGARGRLRVTDNGVGLPSGFVPEHLTSLGVKLATDLARQLGGRLEMGSGPGARFEVEFSLGNR